jgi:hypothetical protein
MIVFEICFFSFLVLALVSAALSFRGPAGTVGLFRSGLIVGAVAAIVSTIAMVVFALTFSRRFERELIYKTIQDDLTDVGKMPALLVGRVLTTEQTLLLESGTSRLPVQVSASGGTRPLSASAVGGLIIIAIGAAFFLIRTIALAVSTGGDGAAVLLMLLAGTVAVIGVPTVTMLTLGALRDRAIRHANPGAVLARTFRTPPLEFAIIQLDHSAADHIRSVLVWSFDEAGAHLWQGSPWPREVVHIPRDRINGIGLQEDAETVNRNFCDRLALVTTREDGREIVVPFIVRPRRSPLMATKAAELGPLRAQIVTALRS